jgi:hypothetical protein
VALDDHGDEPGGEGTRLGPRPQVVADAGEAELGSTRGHPADVLGTGSRVDDLDVEAVVGQQTAGSCRQERQVVAR